jgi:hypothetical protein
MVRQAKITSYHIVAQIRFEVSTADIIKTVVMRVVESGGEQDLLWEPRRHGFKPGSGHVGFCDGQKWRWGRFSPRTSVSPANVHSICFSTIIFTITQGWHNRPGVAAVPIALQTKQRKLRGTGSAITQAVSRRIPIAAARVETRVWSCGIL